MSDLKNNNLLKEIFNAQVPEVAVKKIPAEALYLTIRQNGLPDSLELIEICSKEQLQLFFDLDCWSNRVGEGDRFDEEKFWEWLELPDVAEDTDILKKIIRSLDLKLVARLIARYVHIHISTEPTDEPPEAYYYTPDKGYTWVHVHLAEPHRNFLLNRLLAAIFEYSAEVFYQLISVPNVATESVLEEEAYKERQQRLSAEGFPDRDLAFEITTPLEYRNIKTTDSQYQFSKDISSVPAEVFSKDAIYPLQSLWEQAENTLELDAELTLILNSFFIRFQVSVSEQEEISFATRQVKGAINIALEKFAAEDPLAFYQQYNLQKLFRFGLFELGRLQKKAQKIDPNKLKQLSKTNSFLFSSIAGLLENPPKLAREITEDKENQVVEYLPFIHLSELKESEDFLNSI